MMTSPGRRPTHSHGTRADIGGSGGGSLNYSTSSSISNRLDSSEDDENNDTVRDATAATAYSDDFDSEEELEREKRSPTPYTLASYSSSRHSVDRDDDDDGGGGRSAGVVLPPIGTHTQGGLVQPRAAARARQSQPAAEAAMGRSRPAKKKTSNAGYGAGHTKKNATSWQSTQKTRRTSSPLSFSSRTGPSTNTTLRFTSAKRNRFAALRNELKLVKDQVEEARRENKLLHETNRRTEKALHRYEGHEDGLASILQRHESEIRALKQQLRSSKQTSMALEQRLQARQDELQQAQRKCNRLEQMVASRDLKERTQLTSELQVANERHDRQDLQIRKLQKQLAMDEKNQKRQQAKSKEEIRRQDAAVHELEQRLRTMHVQLKEREKELQVKNIYSQRISHNMPANLKLPPIASTQDVATSTADLSVAMSTRGDASSLALDVVSGLNSVQTSPRNLAPSVQQQQHTPRNPTSTVGSVQPTPRSTAPAGSIQSTPRDSITVQSPQYTSPPMHAGSTYTSPRQGGGSESSIPGENVSGDDVEDLTAHGDVSGHAPVDNTTVSGGNTSRSQQPADADAAVTGVATTTPGRVSNTFVTQQEQITGASHVTAGGGAKPARNVFQSYDPSAAGNSSVQTGNEPSAVSVATAQPTQQQSRVNLFRRHDPTLAATSSTPSLHVNEPPLHFKPAKMSSDAGAGPAHVPAAAGATLGQQPNIVQSEEARRKEESKRNLLAMLKGTAKGDLAAGAGRPGAQQQPPPQQQRVETMDEATKSRVKQEMRRMVMQSDTEAETEKTMSNNISTTTLAGSEQSVGRDLRSGRHSPPPPAQQQINWPRPVENLHAGRPASYGSTAAGREQGGGAGIPRGAAAGGSAGAGRRGTADFWNADRRIDSASSVRAQRGESEVDEKFIRRKPPTGLQPKRRRPGPQRGGGPGDSSEVTTTTTTTSSSFETPHRGGNVAQATAHNSTGGDGVLARRQLPRRSTNRAVVPDTTDDEGMYDTRAQRRPPRGLGSKSNSGLLGSSQVDLFGDPVGVGASGGTDRNKPAALTFKTPMGVQPVTMVYHTSGGGIAHTGGGGGYGGLSHSSSRISVDELPGDANTSSQPPPQWAQQPGTSSVNAPLRTNYPHYDDDEDDIEEIPTVISRR